MHILLITPTSVSVELQNNDSYITDSFEVILNGKSLGMREKNSFSLYDLEPDHSYTLQALTKGGIKELSFRTCKPSTVLQRTNT